MIRRLLAVLAHPDDESFGPGGTLARYAAEGVDVHVAIATDGGAGSVVDGYDRRRDALIATRAAELATAVDILGVTLHNLGYRDSGYIGDPANDHADAFIKADEATAVGRVVALLRALRPQVVVTHDEKGGYFHPDHIFCNSITTRAFHLAGDATAYPAIGPAPYAPERLYYTAFPTRILQWRIWVMRLRRQDPRRTGRNQDIDLIRLLAEHQGVTTFVDVRASWEQKLAASAAHASQGGGRFYQTGIPRPILKRLFATELFRRVHPPLASGQHEKSLFP